MRYTNIPGTDIEVSRIAMGCWGLAGGSMWGEQREKDSIAAVHAAIDNGINFFDTAEGYGDGFSEEVMGRAFQGRRNKVVIATKVSPTHFSRDALFESCDKSLSRLQTDYIDLYQLHWPRRDETPLAETMAAIEELQNSGKIRAFGVCNFGVQNMKELLPLAAPATNQVAYSLLWRPIEQEIVPQCEENNIGILSYSSLLHGILTGKYKSPDDVPDGRARTRHFSNDRPSARHGESGKEKLTFSIINKIGRVCDELGYSMSQVAYAWVMHREPVTSVLAGARTAEQAEANAAIGDIELSNDVMSRLDEITKPMVTEFGKNADMWQSPGRMS
jgi:aryl-alcohol dehydrogenase-like predicted oxidoreductase